MTPVGNTELGWGVPDIHFDSSGNLYGSNGGGRLADNELISIDKASGAGSVIAGGRMVGAVYWTSADCQPPPTRNQRRT